MSYNIENLSFTIFGSGHDSTRNDSGDGMTSFLYSCDYAAFDNTGSYMWVVTKSGDMADRKIRKIDTTTWQEVSHAFENVDVSTQSTAGFLVSIENTNSNLGVLVTDSNEIIVFDLTTDEIYNTISGNLYRIDPNYAPRATLVGDVIRIIGASVDQSKYRAPYATINLSNNTYAQNEQSGGWTISGFYNDTDITFANRNYGDRKALWGVTIIDGAGAIQQWGNFYIYNDDITLDSFARDNYLYIPTKVGDIWRFGKYSVPPDFSSLPSDYIGINANTIVSPPVYTRGKTWASFLMSDGSLAVTDFTNYGILYTGNNPSLTPIAMGDPYIVCAGSDGYTYLARYK